MIPRPPNKGGATAGAAMAGAGGPSSSSSAPQEPAPIPTKPKKPVSYAFRAQKLGLNLDSVGIFGNKDSTSDNSGGSAYATTLAAKTARNHPKKLAALRAGGGEGKQQTTTSTTTGPSSARGPADSTAQPHQQQHQQQQKPPPPMTTQPMRAMKAVEQYHDFLTKFERKTLVNSTDANSGTGSVYYIGPPDKMTKKKKAAGGGAEKASSKKGNNSGSGEKNQQQSADAPAVTEVIRSRPGSSRPTRTGSARKDRGQQSTVSSKQEEEGEALKQSQSSSVSGVDSKKGRPESGSSRTSSAAPQPRTTKNKESPSRKKTGKSTEDDEDDDEELEAELEKLRMEWGHRDHIAFRWEILCRIDSFEGPGAAFHCYDYKLGKTACVILNPLTEEEEEEASQPNLGKFSPDHLIFKPEERFVYAHHLATVIATERGAIQIANAETEYVPPGAPKRSKAIPVKKALSDWDSFLSPYEKEEIHNYAGQIYFLGQSAPKHKAVSPKEVLAEMKKKEMIKASNLHVETKDKKKSSPKKRKEPAHDEDKEEQEKEKEKKKTEEEEEEEEEEPTGAENNFGYDDENHMYKTVFGDHFAYRYEVIDELGQGSFGQVLRCIDHSYEGGKTVAVKIIKNEERFNVQAIVEVRLLEQLRRGKSSNVSKESQDGLVQLLHHFKFRNHVCLVFELCGMNLYELQKERNYAGFSVDEIKMFTQQMLTGMKTLERENIIHCDMKPENILLKSNSYPLDGLRIIDFGSGCYDGEQLYTYIQSRFYRAPEIMLGGGKYTSAIDVWSLGCIICEMALGYPIFPGEDELDQMKRICQVVPPYDDASFEFIAHCPRARKFFHSNGEVRGGNSKETYTIDEVLYSQCDINDPVMVDFILQCLTWDPELRATPRELLRHEFIDEVRSPTKRNRVKRKARGGGSAGSRRSGGGGGAGESGSNADWGSTSESMSHASYTDQSTIGDH